MALTLQNNYALRLALNLKRPSRRSTAPHSQSQTHQPHQMHRPSLAIGDCAYTEGTSGPSHEWWCSNFADIPAPTPPA